MRKQSHSWNSFTERESWTGSKRIPCWRSPWAVFKHCYCEVLPHMSEVEIIDFHRKRFRTAHLLSSFCRQCVRHFIVGVHIDSQNQHQQKPTHLLFKVCVNWIQTLFTSSLTQPKLKAFWSNSEAISRNRSAVWVKKSILHAHCRPDFLSLLPQPLSLSLNQKWVSYGRQAVLLLKEELRLLISTILMTHIHSCHSNQPYSLNSPLPHLIFAAYCSSARPTTAIIEKWKHESGRVRGRAIAGAYLRLNHLNQKYWTHPLTCICYIFQSPFSHLAYSILITHT